MAQINTKPVTCCRHNTGAVHVCQPGEAHGISKYDVKSGTVKLVWACIDDAACSAAAHPISSARSNLAHSDD